MTHKSDHGGSLSCGNFASCILSHIENNGTRSDDSTDVSAKFVYDMFLYDPIRVYFCWVLLAIHYLPLITLIFQMIMHQCVTCSIPERDFGTKIQDNDTELKRADSFVRVLLDLHLTNYFAYGICLVILVFIMIGDIQYHDGNQFYERIFGPNLKINGLTFFLLSNLSFLVLIGNALFLSGPLKSTPDNLVKLLKKGFKNGYKYPLISLGKSMTTILLIINLYFLIFWLLELTPSAYSDGYSMVGIFRGYTCEYALVLFCFMSGTTSFFLCLVHNEKLKPTFKRLSSIFYKTFGSKFFIRMMILFVMVVSIFLFIIFFVSFIKS